MRTIRKLWGRLGAEALLFCVILGIWSYAGANGAAGGKSAETSGAPVMNEMSDADGPDSESSAAAGQGAAGGAAGSGQDGSGEENSEEENSEEENSGEENSGKKDYIHWVDFDICLEAMSQALQCDIDTYGQDVHINWVELLAYLAAGYGGDFSHYKSADMVAAVEKIKAEGIESLTADMKYYSYYKEAYDAVLGGMVGEFETADQENGELVETYGLKAFSPIAKGFPYSHYDDFGVSRSYGYRRQHLGHDLMGQVGTPVIAIESGRVSAMGWNQYGGWRIGIDSFDGKRYYYYAHLRQNRPYAEGLKEGDIVQAGDVIGYMGRTGYSKKENVNNIDEYHLHLGLQLIFDESQREGANEIWIDLYPLTQFLSRHQSEAGRTGETKEWVRMYPFKDPVAEEVKEKEPTEEEDSATREAKEKGAAEDKNPDADAAVGEIQGEKKR